MRVSLQRGVFLRPFLYYESQGPRGKTGIHRGVLSDL